MKKLWTRGLALIAAVAVGMVTLALTSSTVARLLDPNADVAKVSSEAEARSVLGVSLPTPRALPDQMARIEIVVDQARPPVGNIQQIRSVHQTFAFRGVPLARLHINRGAIGTVVGSGTLEVGGVKGQIPPVVRRTLDGMEVQYTQRQLPGAPDLVSYYWESGGLAFEFHAQLANGLTRDMVDRIVRSVR